jgi:uncharacterized protein
MKATHVMKIAEKLALGKDQVIATAKLLVEGATVPFIARYRKEATGSLDEVAITGIRDELRRLEELDKRRESILNSLLERELLTEELKNKIVAAETLTTLEDVYLPYRPKRRTRATVAREKGLEPLADMIFDQEEGMDPITEAGVFVDPEKAVESAEDALAGARDILAERITENQEAREKMRALYAEKGIFRTKVIPGRETVGAKFRDYFDWEEPVATAPSHRILAMRRGENEVILGFQVTVPEEEALGLLEALFVKGDSPASQQVKEACHDAYRRLLANSMTTDIRLETKARADTEAIRIFADNLRELLLTPPLGQKNVLAIDPGIRTGCKVVCLDRQGTLLRTETLYLFQSEESKTVAAEALGALCESCDVEAIAVGNGTAGRETESFVKSLKGHYLSPDIPVVMVNESGASVYSASEAARTEFPDLDVTFRGAVSIGRRLMDPLAELVKIAVGVEINTASEELLTYVSGLGPKLAKNTIAYRNEQGPFSSREALKNVPRLGPKAFEQAAGFLRIRNGANPLDASAVHPESYPIVEAMAMALNCSVKDLLSDQSLRQRIDLSAYVTDNVGMPTLEDILSELAKPGRDPRKRFESFVFAEDVETIEDLRLGMKLPGVVTNVTAFGAFVDVGVHQDGLVHISEIADHFVKDPRQEVRVQQQVTVRVLDVDLARKRISLSMKAEAVSTEESPKKQRRRLDSLQKAKKKKQHARVPKNNPFIEAFRGR